MTQSDGIVLGYEKETGHCVRIPLRHTAVTGQTQESGKTTTLEAIITRSGLRAVAFVTKRGEKSFRVMTPIPVYFAEPEDRPESPLWRWVESLFETAGAAIGRDDRALVIKASDKVLESEKYETKDGETRYRVAATRQKVCTLEEVADNVNLMLRHARGRDAKSLICLDAYFKIVMPQIAHLKASPRLALQNGINVMDLTGMSDEMQMLVIRSVVHEIYRHGRSTVVLIPEAHKFIPQNRKSPVKMAVELFIREGLVIKNVLMLDSQDLASVSTPVLKSIGVWILGKQTEINEVRRTVNIIPERPRVQETEIMRLGKGEFYAVFSEAVKKVYVQPAGMEDLHAQAIARGEESAASWGQIEKRLERTAPVPPRMLQIMEETPDDEETETTQKSDSREVDRHERSENDGGTVPYDARGDAAIPSGTSADEGDEALSLKEKTELEHLREHIRMRLGSPCLTCSAELRGDDPMLALPGTKVCLPDVAAVTPRPPFPKRDNGAPVLVEHHQPFTVTQVSYEEVKRRLLADPAVIAALDAARPTLRVTVSQPVITMSDSGNIGRVALLIHEKFFTQPRATTEITKEFNRRGWGWGGRSNEAVAELVTKGLLRREDAGFQAVPGMKIETVKA